MHVFGESWGNRNLAYLFGIVCKVGLAGSIREVSIYEMSGFNEESWYNYELLSWQLGRTDWIILSVGLLMISNTEKQKLPENSNGLRWREKRKKVCVCEGHLYLWVWFCIQGCTDIGVIAKGVFTKKDHADFLARARVAIVNFLVSFNVNLSSYLNLESGQKHYRSVTLLPEVEFFLLIFYCYIWQDFTFSVARL